MANLRRILSVARFTHESIANASNCLNSNRIVAQFFPNPANMHINIAVNNNHPVSHDSRK